MLVTLCCSLLSIQQFVNKTIYIVGICYLVSCHCCFKFRMTSHCANKECILNVLPITNIKIWQISRHFAYHQRRRAKQYLLSIIPIHALQYDGHLKFQTNLKQIIFVLYTFNLVI